MALLYITWNMPTQTRTSKFDYHSNEPENIEFFEKEERLMKGKFLLTDLIVFRNVFLELRSMLCEQLQAS